MMWAPARREPPTVRATHIEIAGHHGDTVSCVLSVPSWCWGAEHGVNEAGVAMGNESIYTVLDPRGAPDGLIGMDLVRLGLQRATTARDAVAVVIEHIERYGQGGSGHDTSDGSRPRPYWSSFLVADPHEAWVIETSGRTVATMPVTDTWAISNRTTIPGFDAAHRHPRQPVERLVDPRLDASRAVLARRPVSMDAMSAHLSAHVGGADGWTVCMHATVEGEVVEATTASMVVELCADPVVRWTQGPPCREPHREARFSEMASLLSGR